MESARVATEWGLFQAGATGGSRRSARDFSRTWRIASGHLVFVPASHSCFVLTDRPTLMFCSTSMRLRENVGFGCAGARCGGHVTRIPRAA